MLGRLARAARPRPSQRPGLFAVEVRSFSSSSSQNAPRSVFMWGTGDDGQLGLGHVEKSGIRNTFENLLPKEVETLENLNICQISAGFTHSAAVSEDGRLWTWGSNKYGKLGHGTAEDMLVNKPKLVEALQDVQIKQVHCGEYHTAALDSHGRVFTWGWGGSLFSGPGGLGLGNKSDQHTPQLVRVLEEESYNIRVKSVGCGEMHTVALSDNGEVWCWGNGEYGRLGNGGSAHALEPEPLEFFEQTSVSQIAVGHAFTLALTEDGAVYCWGRNDQGQLGLGGGLSMDVYSMENYPRTIEKFEGITVTSLAAGHSHASAVSDEGKLYVWGMRLYLEPNEMTGLRGHKVVQTSCGGNYTAAITDNGDLYTFGKGRSTCLGHEDKKNKQQPTIVEGLKGFAVQSVSCGNRHAGAVAVPRSTAADRDFSMRQ